MTKDEFTTAWEDKLIALALLGAWSDLNDGPLMKAERSRRWARDDARKMLEKLWNDAQPKPNNQPKKP